MKPLYIAVTGGGTGGHIYPLIAVIEELQGMAQTVGADARIRYFGEPIQYRSLFAARGVPVSFVVSSKLRAYASVMNALAPLLFAYGVLQALWKMYWFMPHVVFSKGGPGSLPVVFAARFYHIPIVVHESDVSPGRSTAIAARSAARILVSYDATRAYFPGREHEVAVTGNPVRAFLARGAVSSADARRAFGLDPNTGLPVILVIGGSQGSARVNTFLLSVAEELVKSYQVLHQTGPANYAECEEGLTAMTKFLSDEQKRRYKIIPYFEENVREAYAAADIIVARSGGSAIFEIAVAGKPAILIPLADAARNHQYQNAREYAKGGAAVVIEEDNLLASIFLNELRKIATSAEVRHAMGEAAKRFARPAAAAAVAQEILRVAEGESGR
ncbi:MAG: UDP-N-acetylglucosamine--N-acetylmuramyl-(pentapeptide) pyrophosphoryl-undecaprenol N-acetylglucosamine transferase [Candidatus Liptonbacteria bacterium]|nr:UDP-N-acetylglucosamine--N-acetylmuramyl-(pentapeptide) pyrophosphoryl-undecaprenol N-acetylglucosamine transferase [Candidatus Liptonbacteria bacterium]